MTPPMPREKTQRRILMRRSLPAPFLRKIATGGTKMASMISRIVQVLETVEGGREVSTLSDQAEELLTPYDLCVWLQPVNHRRLAYALWKFSRVTVFV